MFIHLLVAATAGASPLAMADRGFVQCYGANVLKKTCEQIVSYRPIGPGTYDAKSVALIAGGYPSISLEIHELVIVKDDAICGVRRASDILNGIIRIEFDTRSDVLRPEDARPTLESIAKAEAPILNREDCTRYELSGFDITAENSVAGGPYRRSKNVIKWISADAGYRLTK